MAKLKILQAHNYYLQPGGEDTVFEADVAMLRAQGHEVVTYVENTERIHGMNPASVALQTIYSRASYDNILEVVRRERPDIVHFHNIFPLISPAAYYACRQAAVPVVQSLHNPRLICPAASFYRDGHNCTDCFGKTPPYPGVLHACYHHSRAQTSVVASMLTVHRAIGTWNRAVDKYLVATKFYLDLFLRAGLPPEKLALKPHFVDPPVPFEANRGPGEYALFIGRLDPEKGIHVLLEAWKKIKIPLKIRGWGQLEREVGQVIDAEHSDNIQLIGRLSRSDLGRLIQRARFLVWPTAGYYETFGLAAVECFALGVPVLASQTGVNAEIVSDGGTGLYFGAGDADDLAAKMRWAWEHPEAMAAMGRNARREYEEKYTPQMNYSLLMSIYEQVRAAKRERAA